MNIELYNDFGARMAAAAAGVPSHGFDGLTAHERTGADRSALDMGLIKFAANLFETVAPGTAEALLFRRASRAWSPGCGRLAEHVSVGLGKTKAAASLLPVLAATHDKLGGKLLRTLVAAGVLGGAGAGSLGFLLSRNARQSSADNEAMLEKARTYRQLANDIREDMAMSQSTKKPTRTGRYDV